MDILQNPDIFDEAVKALNLDENDRIILGHIAFGLSDKAAAQLTSYSLDEVIRRRKEIMAKLGDIGIVANENMLGLSIFLNLIKGLNANCRDNQGKEIIDQPDHKVRRETAKIYNLITGGMLGRALNRFIERTYEQQKVQEVVGPPEWVKSLNPQIRE